MLAEPQTTAATTAESESALSSTIDSYVGTEHVAAARAAVSAAEALAISTQQARATSSVSGGERLLDLEQQWHAGMAAAETRGLSEEDLDALSTALVPIEMEIASSPCDSMGAFMAKLRTVVRHGAVHGQITAIDDAALIDGMIAFMEGRFSATGDHTAECEVERLSDDFSGAIRTHDQLDRKENALTPQEVDALTRAEDALSTIRSSALNHLPRNRSGLAFQLLVAAGHLDVVQHSATVDADASAKLIRTAIANTLRVLGLPFDYRAAQYFLGPVADDLDGRVRQGLLQ